MLILGGKDDSAEYTLGIKVLGIKGSKHCFPQHPTHRFDFNCFEVSSQGFNHDQITEPLLSKINENKFQHQMHLKSLLFYFHCFRTSGDLGTGID